MTIDLKYKLHFDKQLNDVMTISSMLTDSILVEPPDISFIANSIETAIETQCEKMSKMYDITNRYIFDSNKENTLPFDLLKMYCCVGLNVNSEPYFARYNIIGYATNDFEAIYILSVFSEIYIRSHVRDAIKFVNSRCKFPLNDDFNSDVYNRYSKIVEKMRKFVNNELTYNASENSMYNELENYSLQLQYLYHAFTKSELIKRSIENKLLYLFGGNFAPPINYYLMHLTRLNNEMRENNSAVDEKLRIMYLDAIVVL
jgi:hypothetical protein